MLLHVEGASLCCCGPGCTSFTILYPVEMKCCKSGCYRREINCMYFPSSCRGQWGLSELQLRSFSSRRTLLVVRDGSLRSLVRRIFVLVFFSRLLHSFSLGQNLVLLYVGSLLAASRAWHKSYVQRCILLPSHHCTTLAVRLDCSLQGGKAGILKIFHAWVGFESPSSDLCR